MNYQSQCLFVMYLLYPLVGTEYMIHCLRLVDGMLRVSNNWYELLSCLHTVGFQQRLQDHNLYEVVGAFCHMVDLL